MIDAIATPTTTYTIDKAHSEVTFQVRHLLSKVRGRFSDFEGVIDYDQQQLEHSFVSVTANVASIDTNEPDRDAHLRSADFFDVEQYPTLTFTSLAISRRGKDRFNLAGDLTIHGVTRPVTFAVDHLGKATDPWRNQRLSFEAEATINRKDFGLQWNAPLETGGFLVGDEVKINWSVEAVLSKG